MNPDPSRQARPRHIETPHRDIELGERNKRIRRTSTTAAIGEPCKQTTCTHPCTASPRTARRHNARRGEGPSPGHHPAKQRRRAATERLDLDPQADHVNATRRRNRHQITRRTRARQHRGHREPSPPQDSHTRTAHRAAPRHRALEQRRTEGSASTHKQATGDRDGHSHPDPHGEPTMQPTHAADTPPWARPMWHAWGDGEPGWKTEREPAGERAVIWIARPIASTDAVRFTALAPGRWMLIERLDDGHVEGTIWPHEPGADSPDPPDFGNADNGGGTHSW